MGVTKYLLTGMILQVGICNSTHQNLPVFTPIPVHPKQPSRPKHVEVLNLSESDVKHLQLKTWKTVSSWWLVSTHLKQKVKMGSSSPNFRDEHRQSNLSCHHLAIEVMHLTLVTLTKLTTLCFDANILLMEEIRPSPPGMHETRRK